jgi:hypothetical protein
MRLLLIAALWVVPITAEAQAVPESWQLVKESQIGSVDGPQSLTTVNMVLPARDGRTIYVMQRQDNTIRMFDTSSGKLVRRIGRAGSGPGEFQGLTWIGWKQDTLYAVDGPLQRVSLFSAEGEHLKTERIVSPVLPATHRPAYPSALNANGTVIGASPISMFAVARKLIVSAPIILMTRNGKILRTLAEHDLHDTMAEAAVGSRVAVFKQPMSEGTLIRYAPDGTSLLVVEQPVDEDQPARFRVTRLGPNGDTIYSRAYRYSPRPVSTTARDSIYDAYSTLFTGVTPAKARQAAETYVIVPKTQQPITAAVLSTDGTIWLRREATQKSSMDWLVFDRAGNIRAIVPAPSELKLLAVEHGVAWGVVTDDLDVPYVVRYSVRRAGRK